ncbi:hypothetical protein [uncultured Ilyobacter sp.]|uniref:hypothetical protein n=1 Tax=uncultured Ilyobacter sp. TaxID=544433 RepID=UPI0029C72840|nr:hypothetical protein [uncultured Ilyobacter sp.]
MKKRKVFFRSIMLVFLLAVPLYLFKSVYSKCKITISKRSERKTMLTDEIRKNFLIRKENFFEDKNYKLALEKLKKEKLEVEGVVIIE